MTRFEGNSRAPWPRVVVGIIRASLASLFHHRGMAAFSLVAAFGIWFVIQDVENPRIQKCFPEDCTRVIPVEAINADQFIPTSTFTVGVRVEGREADLQKLSQADFNATVDVKGITPGVPQERQVKVTGKDGIRILSVNPPTLPVSVEPVVERQFDVVVTRIGQLPAGFVEDDIKIEPPQVTVRGLQADLATIASVNLDVNLSNQRDGTTVVDNELVAHSITGAPVDVSITPNRGKVTLSVRQDFVQRTLPVMPVLSGQPAPGYRITSISVEPSAIFVSGPADRMATLTQLSTEALQITNATGEIRRLQNVIVQVKPIDCAAGTTGAACGTYTIQVAPTAEGQPPGLLISGALRVTVQLTGPLTLLDTIQPGQITAKVSLAGAVAGTSSYPVTVTVPANLASQGVKAEQPSPIQITLTTP
jgi:YbbR domain-containing protein